MHTDQNGVVYREFSTEVEDTRDPVEMILDNMSPNQMRDVLRMLHARVAVIESELFDNTESDSENVDEASE